MSKNYGVSMAHHNRGIYQEIVRLQAAGRHAVLAVPVRLGGSVPFTDQSRLLFRDDSTTLGTVGGGLIEAGVLHEASEVIGSDKPSVLEFDLTNDAAGQEGMICGGRCLVLVEPISPDRDTEVYSAAGDAESDATSLIVITALTDQRLVHTLALLPNGELLGYTGDVDTDKFLSSLPHHNQTGEVSYIVDGALRVFIQPIVASPSLYIFGAGHVAIPVAQLAELVGFRTTIIDDRSEFANVERFPGAGRVLVLPVSDAFDALPIGEGSYVISITRGHSLDEEVVTHALRTSAKYIGMIGSKRKIGGIHQRLHSKGFTETDIARIHAPIGIEIGAETVEEIAVSIVAELVAARRMPKD